MRMVSELITFSVVTADVRESEPQPVSVAPAAMAAPERRPRRLTLMCCASELLILLA
jgi:hypothetical protein